MSIRKGFFLVSFVMIGWASKAQTSRESNGVLKPQEQVVEPLHHKKIFHHRESNPYIFKRGKVTHSARYEYYKRVEMAAKAHQRILKKMYKPQYSNFLYYGHRRKPKKHTADKLRYCPECGIRH